MTQNLVSLAFSAEDIATIRAAIATLEEKWKQLIHLSVDERHSLNKMGDKSEAACRQTLIILANNPNILPPDFNLAEAQQDLAALDQLRPLFASIHQLSATARDTEMALGSDFLSAMLEGYALSKAAGSGNALDALREAMSNRFGRTRRNSASTVN
ncbi:MAG: hypothetical protein V5B32_10005 [Candidatus Accumulibacter sp. UW26]|jgi:hypothetical protein